MFLDNSSNQLNQRHSTNITQPFINAFLSSHQFLIAAQNSTNSTNQIQAKQFSRLNPKIALFLKNLFEQNVGTNQTIEAYRQYDVKEPEVDTLDSIVKVNKDIPIDIAIFMFGYIMPLLLIITILFNSMIVVVLSQKHLRTPTNMVLLAMAIFDMLTLVTPFPWYFYAYFLGELFLVSCY